MYLYFFYGKIIHMNTIKYFIKKGTLMTKNILDNGYELNKKRRLLYTLVLF